MDGEELLEPPEPKKTGWWRKLLKIILIFLISLVGLATIAVGVTGYILYKKGVFEPPDFSKLEDSRATSIFFDETGKRIKEYCTYCREFAKLSEMGHFPKIAIAVEDKNFNNRWMPYDKWAFLRAVYQNIKTRSIKMGGSTITMQTARNIFLEQELQNQWNEKDPEEKRHIKIDRKIREAIYAAYLEYYYGKDNRWKILELYLNIANCGRNLYGVVACSHYWYGKEPKELSIGEAAWIAELWRRPRYWHMEPEDKDEALKHRGLILDQLANERVITRTEHEELNKFPLPEGGKQISPGCNAPHAAEFARVQITKEMQLADMGLKVYTTLNCDWQNAGAQALHSALEVMKKRNPKLENDLWGTLIAIDTHGGGIKVFAQEPSFTENQYRIDLIKRHAGSAAKPFTYLSGLLHRLRMSCADEGTGPCKLNDSPSISIYINPQMGRKRIHNFPDNRPPYNGSIEPMFGLLRSLNAGTMSMLKGVSGGIELITKDDVTEVLLRLGIELPRIPEETARQEALKNLVRWFPKESEAKLRARRDAMSRKEIEHWAGMSITIISKDLAERMGISRLYYDPGKTVAIGSVDISPFETARAWSAFYGPMVEPRIVDEIRNGSGEQVPYLIPEPINAMENLWIETKKEAMRQTKLKLLYEELKKKELEKRREEAIAKGKQPPSKLPSHILYELLEQARKTPISFDEDTLRRDAPTEAAKIQQALIRGLRAVVESPKGTGHTAIKGDEKRGIPKLDFQVACKTGTATNQKGETTDNWFVCRTVSHVVAAWIGRKNKLPMETILANGKKFQETGGKNALWPVVVTLDTIYKNYPKEQFPAATNPFKPFRYQIDIPDYQEIDKELTDENGEEKPVD